MDRRIRFMVYPEPKEQDQAKPPPTRPARVEFDSLQGELYTGRGTVELRQELGGRGRILDERPR
jgi:hypothetical protein